MTDAVTITSFRKQCLEEAKSHSPDLPTGWMVPLESGSPWDDIFVEPSLALGVTHVCPRADFVTPEIVEMRHSIGFVVRCHGARDEDLMRHVVYPGADGMIISFREKLAVYLNQR